MTGLVEIPDGLQYGLHFGSAGLFIGMMAYFCLALFPIGPRTTGSKTGALRTYYICGGLIVVAMAGLLALFIMDFMGKQEFVARMTSIHAIFWLESLAVISFAIAWLVKGKPISRPLGRDRPLFSH